VEEDLDISVDFFRYDVKLLMLICANYFYLQTVAFEKLHYAYFFGLQGDHWDGKAGNVREFYSCHGNLKKLTKIQ